MSQLFINVYDHNRQEMWWSSLKYATDMGSKERCQTIVDDDGNRMAIYNSNKANVTQLRGIARSGYCLPIECTMEDLNSVADMMDDNVNKNLKLLSSYGINIHTMIFRTPLS